MAAAVAVAPPSAKDGDDDNVSPHTRAPPIPSSESLLHDKANGYTSSPLRTEQRPSTVDESIFPRVPDTDTPLRLDTSKLPMPPSFQFAPPSPGAFPFHATPGSVGPSPTTGDKLVHGAMNGSTERVPSPGGIARKRQQLSGSLTPPDRRSVQFANGTQEDPGPTPLAKTLTWETDDGADEQHGKERQHSSGSFFMKLKNFTNSGHSRSPSSTTATGFTTPNAALSPQSERSDPILPSHSEAIEDEADADLDDSEAERGEASRPRKRQKSKRPQLAPAESSPSTPRASRFASFIRDHPIPGRSSSRPPAPSRRATMSDVAEHDESRAGVSEDEGRDRIKNAWRRGIEGARGLSYAARKEREGGEAPESSKRPVNLRRLTNFGGPQEGSSSPFRMRADRHNSVSAQKWRQVKAGIKMLGQRKKEERMKIDHQKSAQLMAELLAGAPAALIFASMFQRDEHHHRKVPVLLEQLKISVPDVRSRTDKKGDRDFIYKVDLEYGNGPARMRWTIYRSVGDFVNLHVKYRTQEATDKVRHLRSDDKSKAKIPRFPKSVIPYARGMRGLFEKMKDEEDEHEPLEPPLLLDGQTSANNNARRPNGHRRGPSSLFGPPQRQSTSEIGNTSADPEALTVRQRELYAERSRQKIEVYLQQMIRWLIFRPDSSRLCKFLELSAMAIRLSAEGGYQGKQGLLQIASRRHRELHRKTLQTLGPAAIKERHKRRWFLVRHSYIVCVDGPESLNPYDVFLVDSEFSIGKQKQRILDQKTAQDMAKIATENATPSKKAHLIQLYNAERNIKLLARNEKHYLQFRESLTHMMHNTVWAQKQRFGSFAPVRNNVWCRWLVDGRDHMWQVSRAIDNAKDFVYIHDWWLSPELYMRRPAAISQKWRLDRLLQRKAQQGVKIFVIVYRNIESAIPIDSEYTKWSLLDLHENIIVQRSPNQLRQNQFFWAHHEKLVVVDNMMAFVGGVDLCFGRWDDPCHSLTDDKLTGFELDPDMPRDSEHCQVWPGKDYSNPRVQDFYALDRPYEEMYDRTKVPRMPWHDIAMQIVGQPARDLGRHFVQRWNYILRSRVPSRPTPVLMPPPEYDQEELNRLGMTGTCQVQLLRSCSSWSIGTPNRTEHSIMNAYVTLIRESEHFVYIENQFFISSCTVEGTTIHNKIGDAIVERAIRAHEKREAWQCCLVIPLMPGFQNSVDAQDGTSVRLIMQCQYRSICRGDTSIFARLRAVGIDPEDYVRFYSLRQWGKIGPNKCLTTEQLYIHAKCMIVDDRSVIIGSANINERSLLGSRDSEVAAIVSDTCMIPSFMAGKPYSVGEFPHSLRKRLMREHLGIDVDAIYRREQMAAEREEQDAEMNRIYRDDHATTGRDHFETPPQTPLAPAINAQMDRLEATTSGFAGLVPTVNGPTPTGFSDQTLDHQATNHMKKSPERDLDVDGYGFDNMKGLMDAGDNGLRDSYVDAHGREVLLKRDAPDTSRIRNLEQTETFEKRSAANEAEIELPARPPWPTERLDTMVLGLPTRSRLPELPNLDDTDIGGPPLSQGASTGSKKIGDPLLRSLKRPEVHEDCMTDPLATGFYKDIWQQVAENNTKIYRQVFRCMPDSEVIDWKTYEKFNAYNEAFMQSQGLGTSKPTQVKGAPGQSGPPGAHGTAPSSPVSEGFLDPGSKAKMTLGGLVNKLRPGSKTSEADTSQTEEVNEKGPARSGSPGSPGSGASSGPTAVPSSDQTPLDEKEAIKNHSHTRDQDDQIQRSNKPEDSEPPLDEKAAAMRDDNSVSRTRTVQYDQITNVNSAPETTATQSNPTGTALQSTPSQKRRRRATTKSSGRPLPEEVLSKDEAESLLNLVQGSLVLWPYDWLEKEERGGNWLYSIDQLAPLEIYD